MNIDTVFDNNVCVVDSLPCVEDKIASIHTCVVDKRADDKKKKSVFIPIGDGKGVKVCRYRQKLYINIRDCITTKDGRVYASKRGILLTPSEWKQLKKM